jgi:putative ABC transport system permease protein
MRFIRHVIKVALRALRRNILRSVLTALGIIIGVAAVIAMVSIGNGAKSQVEAQIASLGQNIISVFPGSAPAAACAVAGAPPALTPEDARHRREVTGIVALSPEMSRPLPGPRQRPQLEHHHHRRGPELPRHPPLAHE